jgi:hypothetical protein
VEGNNIICEEYIKATGCLNTIQRILFGNSEGRRQYGRTRHRWIIILACALQKEYMNV